MDCAEGVVKVPRAQASFGRQSRRVLYSAWRRAWAHQSERIGTEHLLYGVLLRLQWDPVGWTALQRALRERDRAPATGPEHRDQGVPVASLEVRGALREAAWMVARGDRGNRPLVATAGWRPDVEAALDAALAMAAADGVQHVGPRYLLAAVLADASNGARDLLRACGVDPSRLSAAAQANRLPGRDEPLLAAVEKLAGLRVLPTGSRASGLVYAPLRPLARLTSVDPMLVALEMEAVRQAVRVGSEQVHTGHLLLAMLEMDRNLQVAGATLPDQLAVVSGGGQVLAEHGVDHQAAAVCVEALVVAVEPAVRAIPGPWWWKPGQRRWWRVVAADPQWAISAGDAADRAQSDARSQGTRAGSSHLLVAALADAVGPAARVLRELGAAPEAVAQEAARQLRAATT